MPQPYLCLFNRLDLPLSDVVARTEPILAGGGFTFSGRAVKFERGTKDRALYYRLDHVKAESLADGVVKAADEGWPGVAFECHYLGKEVTVGVFQEPAGTVLSIDEDSVLFYDRQKDEDLYKDWASLLLRTTDAVGATVCVYRKGGVKDAVDVDEVRDALQQGALKPRGNPIHVIVRDTVFSYNDAAVLDLDRFRVKASTSGYTIITWLHPEP